MTILLEGVKLGSQDVLPTTSLAGLRSMLSNTFPRLPGLPDAFLFLRPDSLPIPQDQEDTMPSLVFLPEINITPEEMKRKRRNRAEESGQKLSIVDRLAANEKEEKEPEKEKDTIKDAPEKGSEREAR